ncbi:hypothetical protein TYRP_018394 [Tyrophagus putrescentiae]|nr:hypothetical protein TYRP_018394 [Tyrophagus putrescentiae]
MRFFSPSLAIGLLLLLCCLHATTPSVRGYYFSESKEDLATLESTPGVSIVYPRAVGPSATEVEGAPSDVKGSEEVATAATTTTTAPPTTTTTTATADAEAATTTTTTTTAAPTTTDASSSESTPGTSSSSSSSTTTPPSASVEANVNLPFGIRASASASSVSSSPSVSSSNNNGGVNRLWHYNSQGLNTNSIWFSPVSSSSRAAAAAEELAVASPEVPPLTLKSSQSPVSVRPEAALSTASTQASLPSPTASTTTTTTTTTSAAASPNPVFFRRQPILADENSASLEIDGNSLSRRIGSPTNRAVVGSFGEYRGRGESERNLYYPDISRIQSVNSNSANSVNSGLLASSSSSSSSSTSASSSASTAASNSAASFGFKGGAGFQSNQNLWTQSERFTAPVKSVRKVVKTSSQLQNEAAEKTTFNREPVRVRVVVQKPQLTTGSFGGVKAEFQNNYLERLQEANNNRKSQATVSTSAAAAAAASASSSQSFFTTAAKSSKTVSKFNEYASKATDSSEKEYVQVTNQFTHAGIKSPPPPPPKPAAVKTTTYATKSAVKSVVRQPVFEQQTYDRYEVEQPEPEPYSYNWQYGDETGNGQFRREEQDKNGVVRGSYGYTDAWGLYRVVDFIADKDGYRASIRSNEPGLVERNPVTNQVDAPANIKIAAEDTPQKVVELMRLTKPKKVTYQ